VFVFLLNEISSEIVGLPSDLSMKFHRDGEKNHGKKKWRKRDGEGEEEEKKGSKREEEEEYKEKETKKKRREEEEEFVFF
jgi:hypothetical protein